MIRHIDIAIVTGNPCWLVKPGDGAGAVPIIRILPTGNSGHLPTGNFANAGIQQVEFQFVTGS
jgi:hypothetical protein